MTDIDPARVYLPLSDTCARLDQLFPEWRERGVSMREAVFLMLRRGLWDGTKHNYAEIGRVGGICRERARQIVKQAEARLAEAVP